MGPMTCQVGAAKDISFLGRTGKDARPLKQFLHVGTAYPAYPTAVLKNYRKEVGRPGWVFLRALH